MDFGRDERQKLVQMVKCADVRIAALEKIKRELEERVERSKLDHRDILDYKSRMIAEQELKIEELKLCIESARSETTAEIAALKDALTHAEQSAQTALKLKDAEIATFQSRVADADAFLKAKNSMESEIFKLKSAISKLQTRFSEQMHEKDIENIKNITQLKEKMLANLAQAQRSFAQRLDGALFESVRDTIGEFSGQAQAAQRSGASLASRAEELERRENALGEAGGRLRLEQQRSGIVAAKILVRDQEIESLKNRIDSHNLNENWLRDELKKQIESFQNLEAQFEEFKKSSEAEKGQMTSEVADLKSQNATLEGRIAELKTELSANIRKMIDSATDREIDCRVFREILALLAN